MKIGDKVKVLRLLEGIGQREFATMLGSKVATNVNRWEQGLSVPRVSMLQNIGDELNIYWPWLQDSTFDFIKNDNVIFRPLSPYRAFTHRWLTLLPKELASLFPALCRELNLIDYWCFDAPCEGGVVVAAKQGLSLMVICRPELYPSLRDSLPSYHKMSMADREYAELLFTGTNCHEIFARCGIDYIHLQEKHSSEPPALPSININLTAKVSASTDLINLQEAIKRQLDNLVAELLLQDVSIDVSALPAKSTNKLILELIDTPTLKNLAQSLTEKESF